MIRAFNNAISGLSAGSSTTVCLVQSRQICWADLQYLQVFLAVGIFYYLWAFLFSNFRRADKVASRRAYLWEVSRPWVWKMGADCQSIHFPLLFALLLLFGAIVVGRSRLTHTLKLTLRNVIVVLSYAQGIRTVSDEFTQTLYAIHNGTNLSEDQQYSTAVYLNKLNLEPPCVASPTRPHAADPLQISGRVRLPS